MKIRFLFAGRTGTAEADRITAEFVRRIGRFCPVEVRSVGPATARALKGAARARRESVALAEAAGPRDAIVVLDSRGQAMTSEAFARWLDRSLSHGAVSFAVGGAEGLTAEILDRASLRLSLSTMTLPHELARAVLAEQVYRALCLIRGTPYPR